MYTNDEFAKLQNLLVGKTIESIKESQVCEGICEIALTSGERFRLNATDLGFWITGLPGDEGWGSLDDLVDCISEKISNYDVVGHARLSINTNEDNITFILEHEEFVILRKNLKQDELRYFTDEQSVKKLVRSISSISSYWKKSYDDLKSWGG